MTVIFPVCSKDIHLLLDLLLWIKQLGGCGQHKAIICADGGVSFDETTRAIMSARQSFSSVELITNGAAVAGWIPGSNSLWATAANYCRENNLSPWLFMEPDAVPLKTRWLDELQKEWEYVPCIALGYIYPSGSEQFPPTMLSGVSVYTVADPSDFDLSTEAFDVQYSRNRAYMLKAKHTPLIQHFWGEPGLPPTFRATKDASSPRNTFTMANITPGAVLFHRNKDGSLIRMLRKAMGIKTSITKSPFITVLPVCNKDVELMIKCLTWMVELEGNNGCDALLTYDTSLFPPLRKAAFHAAAQAFGMVTQYEYPRPPIESWPDACNWAFQYTARHINEKIKRPWFWMEADSTPLKAGWLRAIQDDYVNCGKAVYGPVVHPPGHINGTAIYPPDFAEIAPRAMSATNMAWDTEMTRDIEGISFDGGRLMQHAWGMVEGRLDETTGPAAVFADVELVRRWIKPEAVWFHRVKDGSLIDRLREMKR